MSENFNKFLELVSKDAELSEKVRAADPETLITIAKEVGIVLTEADFAPSSTEISDDELDVVAGGKRCHCVMGGGGTGDDNDKTCACVAFGAGLAKDSSLRCYCGVGGGGENT